MKALKTNPKAKKLFQSTRKALAVFDHWPEDTKISRDEFVYILHEDSWSNWKAVEGDRENVDWKPFQAKSDAIKAKRDVLRKFKDMSKRLDIDYNFFKGKVDDLKTANELAKLEEEIDDYFNKLSVEINLLSKQATKMFVDLEDNGVGWFSKDYLTQEEFDKIDVVEKLRKLYLSDLKRLLGEKKTEAAEKARLAKEAEEKRKAEEEAAAAAAEKARRAKEAEEKRKADEKARLEKEAEETRKAEEAAAAAAEEKARLKKKAEGKRKADEKALREKEAEKTRKAKGEAAAAEKARLEKEAEDKRKAAESASRKKPRTIARRKKRRGSRCRKAEKRSRGQSQGERKGGGSCCQKARLEKEAEDNRGAAERRGS